jgi:hypothetical protein
VTDAAGMPVPNARVIVDDAPEIRTDAEGRFTVRDVVPGSRQVEALAIGMSPDAAVVDVPAGDTARFAAQLHRVTTLDAVRVTASARGRAFALGFEERKHAGLGYARDSSTIGRMTLMSSVFEQFPATQVKRGPGTRFALLMKNGRGQWCDAVVWIDNVRTDGERLNDLMPEDIAAIEAYPHGTFVPTEFTSLSARKEPCGAAVVWTKRAFK